MRRALVAPRQPGGEGRAWSRREEHGGAGGPMRRTLVAPRQSFLWSATGYLAEAVHEHGSWCSLV
jgi:hypothetical protein